MSDANKYKLLTEECLKLAETVSDAREKRALLEIAWAFAQLVVRDYRPRAGAQPMKLQ